MRRISTTSFSTALDATALFQIVMTGKAHKTPLPGPAVGSKSWLCGDIITMKVCLLHAGIASSLLIAFVVESAASNIPPLRHLQTYHNGHNRALSSSAESLNTTVRITPSAAPSMHPSVKISLSSSAPSALLESKLDPTDNSLSMSAATASDSSTMSDSSTIPDKSQQQQEESGIFGMSLFQTCAAVILVATVVGLFGHFGMKLLPYNRHREDNSRNDVQLEDSLASFRTLPRTSLSHVGV